MTALTLAQLRLEQKNFWRNRQAASFSFGMPIMIVLFLGGLFHDNGTVGVGGALFKSYFVAGMVGVALMSATFVNMAINLAFQRDLLVLKRFRGSPLGVVPLFAGKVLNGIVIGLIEVALILGIGRVAYETPFPRNPAAFALAVLAGAAVCSMAGVAITAFIANADSAPAVVNLPFLALQFVSGVFFTFQDMPRPLRYIGDAFPLRWLVESLRAAYLGFDYVHTRLVPVTYLTSNNGVTLSPVTVHRPAPVPVHGFHAITSMGVAYAAMAAWFIACTVIAVRRFRWEPRPD
ncbi:MAG: type transporter [Acidimicrobiales bacterium]|nr:type transporter [Acidimicrobiales bacterium]